MELAKKAKVVWRFLCDDGIKYWFNEEEDKWSCEEDLQIS